MPADMTRDFFAEQPYGKVALKKFGHVPENFRIYHCAWLNDRETMKITGAVFRKAKKGHYKGVLSIKIPGTQKTVYVHKDEWS